MKTLLALIILTGCKGGDQQAQAYDTYQNLQATYKLRNFSKQPGLKGPGFNI